MLRTRVRRSEFIHRQSNSTATGGPPWSTATRLRSPMSRNIASWSWAPIRQDASNVWPHLRVVPAVRRSSRTFANVRTQCAPTGTRRNSPSWNAQYGRSSTRTPTSRACCWPRVPRNWSKTPSPNHSGHRTRWPGSQFAGKLLMRLREELRSVRCGQTTDASGRPDRAHWRSVSGNV